MSWILYSKLVNISRAFSWVLWAILAMIEPEKGVKGTPDLSPLSQKYRCDGSLAQVGGARSELNLEN